jgi:hypothetical protein
MYASHLVLSLESRKETENVKIGKEQYKNG